MHRKITEQSVGRVGMLGTSIGEGVCTCSFFYVSNVAKETKTRGGSERWEGLCAKVGGWGGRTLREMPCDKARGSVWFNQKR